LKENFDRFNFAIHKEKEMADFRRCLTALALAALFVGLASAQGGLNGGAGSMSCSTTTTVTPTVRSEGFTELVGDIVLNCTGGTALTFGSQIPQANITVFLNTAVTSRILGNGGANNASEALLLIDEPGSTTVSGYGAGLAQMPCTTTNQGCTAWVGNSGSGTGVPVTVAGGSTAAPNVFQGVVSGNSVTFFGVPILPPATTGSRIFRITNVRANANGISGGGPTPGTITGSISISPSNAFTINQPLNTLAFVQAGLTTSIRSSSNGGFSTPQLAQCNTNNGGSGNSGNGFPLAVLRYTENFPTAFKTRVAVGVGVPTNTNPLGFPSGATTTQNVPGQIYNAESGFLLNVNPTGGGAQSVGVTAGLADFGTRLKAVFSNIPSGVSVFVSTTNVNSATSLLASQAGQPIAQLVISETVPDANGSLAFATGSTNGQSGSVSYAPVSIVNGAGVAVWEVLNNNYTTNQNFDFGVFLNYTGNAGNNSPAPGPISVSQSFAPNPTNGAFTASAAAAASSSLPIPRFADTGTGRTLANINICQTVLMYPYVTTATGFDTGLAIANTTQDPFGTTPQTGSCALNWYQAGASGTNPALTTTPAIPGGTVYTTLASATTNAGQNFTGYMIAVCNFQFGHGYAAVTDVGARGIFSSYLALVMPNRSTGALSESLGN
jgi:hypothetical protein